MNQQTWLKDASLVDRLLFSTSIMKNLLHKVKYILWAFRSFTTSLNGLYLEYGCVSMSHPDMLFYHLVSVWLIIRTQNLINSKSWILQR